MSTDVSEVPTKWVPSRALLHTLTVLGVFMVTAAFVLGGYHFFHDGIAGSLGGEYDGGCKPAGSHHKYNPYGYLLPTCSGIRWRYLAVLFVLGLVPWVYSREAYKRWHVLVYSGTVVGRDMYSSLLGSTWYVVIDGLTKAGEARRYWVPVSYMTWEKTEKGQQFSWH